MIEVGAFNNTIGGTAPGAGNVISANHNDGVSLFNGASNNVIAGNLLGTNASGNAALGNLNDGVVIADGSNGNVVGGTTAGAGNVISGNQGYGVQIATGSSSNLMEGNDIGTTLGGAGALGTARDGVQIGSGSTNNVVGGLVAGAGNVIDNNGHGGVALNSVGTGNSIEENVIDANGFTQTEAGFGDGVVTLDSPSVAVVDNTIESNRDWGIDFDCTESSSTSTNTLLNNGLGGVSLS